VRGQEATRWRPARSAPPRPPEILIGIRDQGLRDRTAVALGDLGRPIVRVGDGLRLVERIADAVLDNAGRPGLIVADAVLPGCTGLTLLSGVRALHWDTPVILLTQMHEQRERGIAWAQGVTGVFVDPIDVADLRSFAALVLDPATRKAVRTVRDRSS
jgi:CheY-like chemotaxis protein